MIPLEGIEVTACKYLPKTIKDKDGKEWELLGILQEGEWNLLNGERPILTLLLGKEMKHDPTDQHRL